MGIDIKKVYSDNPYVDELVYYTLQLGLDTTLKLQQKADDNETLDIIKAADTYIACIEGHAILGLFDEFPYEVLTSTLDKDGRPYGAGLPDNIAVAISKNKDYIDTLGDLAKQNILNAMKIWYREHYVEQNAYYRELNGLPPIGGEDIFLSKEQIGNLEVDISLPIHMMNKSDISILENAGIIDSLYNEKPKERGYLRHLGIKKIDIYTARKAFPFQALYVPSIKTESIREMYMERLANNRTYTMRAVYSEAYKYDSDYYDNIIAILIVLVTMIDIISRVQEFITRKEIFDIRSCEYLFDSYGVEFFPEIPLRYQIAMVKNIHTLLKYKSTAKCMVDICSLFGFDNVQVFKYYLLKDRTVNLATGEYNFTGDPDKDYRLKFVKLPLEEDIDNYIRKGTNHIDYDEITEGDVTWDGGEDHEMIKQEVYKEEFNIVRTKYISIDTVYDIAKMSAQITYFFNMLYDNYEVEELLKVRIPFIDGSHEFNFADTFSFLTALSYYYYGVKDELMDTQEKVLFVNGFNFKADLAELAASLEKTGHTLHAMEQLKKFIIPEGQIPSFEQMMNMFVNNLDIREELIKGMNEADNLRVFLVYRKLYNSLCTVQLTMDHFHNPETGDFWRDEQGDATYTEYFKHVEPNFYYELMDIKGIEDVDDRKQRIATMIDNIVIMLENYINLDEFQALLHGLPAVSAEAIKQYIAMVINFYKSYKVDFLGLNTIYYLDDKLDGVIRLIDDVFLFRNFTKNEMIYIRELISSLKVNMTYSDKIKLLETIFLDIKTWVFKDLDDRLDWKIKDKLGSLISRLEHYSVVFIQEIYSNTTIFDSKDNVRVVDLISGNHSTMCEVDSISMRDKVWLARHYWVRLDNATYGWQYVIEPFTIMPNDIMTVKYQRVKSSSSVKFIPDLSFNDIDIENKISIKPEYDKFTITTGDFEYPIIGKIVIIL